MDAVLEDGAVPTFPEWVGHELTYVLIPFCVCLVLVPPAVTSYQKCPIVTRDLLL